MVYKFTDHTADVRLELQCSTLNDLFSEAAKGLTSYLFDSAVFELEADKSEDLELTSASKETLLVDWLSRILYLTSVNGRAYIKSQVTITNECSLHARIESAYARQQEEIKAVTHHGLCISQANDQWEATVTFDI